MSLATLVRNGVALAQRLTADLQVDVTHVAYGPSPSLDTWGKPATAPTTTGRPAFVRYEQQQVRTSDGRLVLTRARVTFLASIPVGPFDTFTLPDGTSGAALAFDGVADPGADGALYVRGVRLG